MQRTAVDLPVSFEKPYADCGIGVSRMCSSVVGNSVARSNTIDEDTYTSRSTRSSRAARKTAL